MPHTRSNAFLAALGPGLLFAGAAVGVSHLVQSTRAGAMYGLGFLLFALIANVLKYPAFRFGPMYSAATGTSLLEGYRRQGRWVLWLFLGLTLLTMFTVLGAVTLVTAGLIVALSPVALSPITASVGLLVVCAGLLAVGQYHILDKVMKGVVAILTVSTVAAAGLAFSTMDFAQVPLLPPKEMTRLDILFLAGFVGWMPSAIDVSVWQSLWTLARARDVKQSHSERDQTEEGTGLNMRAVMADFHVGYIGTVVLALCFLVLGAGVMYQSGATFEASAGAFAGQVIDLYAAQLGDWSRPIVGLSALLVMFSTTFTVLDGFPRALDTLYARFQGPELGQESQKTGKAYWIGLFVICLGAMVIISTFVSSLKSMVDLATTLSFLTAPILATLNHRAMTSADVPEALRPKLWLRGLSVFGIGAMSVFATYYLYLRFLAS